MSMKLMYITNNPKIATIAESSGVDRIFVDMEYIGKSERQGGMDTVQNRHTISDVKNIRQAIHKAELLVRCNPIHDEVDGCSASEKEINEIIEAGADIVMLPYFKTVDEAKRFLRCVGGRARTMLLLETPEAVDCIDEILELEGIDEMYIGLNDLSLGYGKKFMFELLADGTVESLCLKFRLKGIPYGFGGIASLGKGLLHSERVIGEHYRLGSSRTILSRSFCNIETIENMEDVQRIFSVELCKIREHEKRCEEASEWLWVNHNCVIEDIKKIVG